MNNDSVGGHRNTQNVTNHPLFSHTEVLLGYTNKYFDREEKCLILITTGATEYQANI